MRTQIDPTDSVNELLRQNPDAIATLHAHGIDTCCGGDIPLDEAARLAGVPLDQLIGEVVAATRSTT